MIEQLTQQIQALQDSNTIYFILTSIIFLSGIPISAYLTNRLDNLVKIMMPTILGVSMGIIMIIFVVTPLNDQILELQIQQNNLIRQVYISMSCPELRLNILDQMQNNNQTWIEFQQDYYNLNCETPLREEVLKLQEKT